MRGHIAYVSNDPVQAYKDGYAKGLQEAREGIAEILADLDEALPPLIGTAEFGRSFLVAIDALREERK